MLQAKVAEEIKTRFMLYLFFEYRAVYKNVENYCMLDRPQMTVWRIRIACWIPKATNTHTQNT